MLCSVARGVTMLTKLVCVVLFLYAFVENRHSLGFIVGCGKSFPPVFISQCVGYYCKCPHSTIKPVVCGAVSQAGNWYFNAIVKAGTWFSSCLLLRLVYTLGLVTSFMGLISCQFLATWSVFITGILSIIRL